MKHLNFSKLLNNDTVVKILSVLVAIIVWLVVTITVYTNIFDVINDIPVNLDLTNTTPEAYNLSIIEGSNQTVNVKPEGKRDKILLLTKEDFIAVPTLTQVTKAGEHEIKVEVKKVNERDDDYKIISEPTYIKVKFDQLIEKEFPVQVSAENVVPEEGYIREESFSNPEKIKLSGPLSEISKIAKCVVQNNSTIAANETVVLEGELAFYDEFNNKLTFKHTKYEVQKYEITIPVNKLKTVPITFGYVNVPQGIDPTKLKYTMSLNQIKIAGPGKIIDEINEISLGEIDYRMIDIGYAPDLEINVLAGIINVDNINSVVVDFSENDLKSDTFTIPSKNITTRNVPSSYNIDIETKTINSVKIVGNKLDIEKLTSNDLIAYVDFAGKEIIEGSSRQTVQIYITGNKFAWAVGEYRVVVNITKKNG